MSRRVSRDSRMAWAHPAGPSASAQCPRTRWRCRCRCRWRSPRWRRWGRGVVDAVAHHHHLAALRLEPLHHAGLLLWQHSAMTSSTPTREPMCSAAARLSPVSSTVRMPCPRIFWMAAALVSFTGSATEIRPSRVPPPLGEVHGGSGPGRRRRPHQMPRGDVHAVLLQQSAVAGQDPVSAAQSRPSQAPARQVLKALRPGGAAVAMLLGVGGEAVARGWADTASHRRRGGQQVGCLTTDGWTSVTASALVTVPVLSSTTVSTLWVISRISPERIRDTMAWTLGRAYHDGGGSCQPQGKSRR